MLFGVLSELNSDIHVAAELLGVDARDSTLLDVDAGLENAGLSEVFLTFAGTSSASSSLLV